MSSSGTALPLPALPLPALPLPALQQGLPETAETAAFSGRESSHNRNSSSSGTILPLPARQQDLPETAETACFSGRDSQDRVRTSMLSSHELLNSEL